MNGARFILNSRYFHIAKPGEAVGGNALLGSHIENLVEYVGTRETVDYNLKDVSNTAPATEKQKETIDRLLRAAKKDYEKYECLEYNDYKENPTLKNASELISRLSEDIYLDGSFDEAANLVEYAAKRPGAYRIGEHGLFSSYDNVDLQQAMAEISSHKGNVWTHILSLRREDAANLGYESQKPWRDLVKSNIDLIAKEHGIKSQNLRWYAAMHNTTHHPHIHLFVFSSDPKEGFLSEKKNRSITKLRSKFASEIFKEERHEIYIRKDTYQTELIEKSRNILDELLKNPNSFFENQQLMEIANKMITLSERLPQTGRRKYGFLKAEEKNLVNDIQIKLIENNTKLNELYQNWCNEKYQLDKYYTTKVETIPIDKNDNFKVIKNEIIKHAYNIKEILDAKLSANASSTPQHLSDEYSNGFYQSKNDFEILDTTAVPTYNEMPKSVYYDSDNKTTITGKFEKLYQQSVNLDTRTGESCRKLADCYNYGNGTEKNPAEAQMWYGISADNYKDSIAAYRLGQMYLYGADGIETDVELGNYYCKTAFCLFRDEIKNSEFFYNLENEDTSYLPYFSDVGKEDAYKEYLIGRMYLNGEGVEQNYFSSFKAFELAAKNGYAHANYYIGNQYYYGLGFEQDFEKALHYYSKASSQGDSYATYKIGKMYLNGEGTETNLKQAEHFFNKATNNVVLANYDLAKLYEENPTVFPDVSKEYIYSLYSVALKGLIEQETEDIHDSFTEIRIANMYLNGKGTEVNIPEAVKWFEKAAKLENPNASYQLGCIYSSDKSGVKDLEKSYKNYALALKGYEKAETENSNATAEYRIGMMYLNGLGVDKDIKKALSWLNKATLNGNDSAAYKLAVLYDEGVEITQDTEKARVYYTLSAELGNPYAEFKLGTLALEDANVQQAVEHFEKACKKNISHAWYKLGQIYSLEHLNMVDNDKAYYCYSKALEQYINDYTKAPDNFTAYRIGNMYLHGQGTEINISQAVAWFTKSAELNNPDAAYQLGYIYKNDTYGIKDNTLSDKYFSSALSSYLNGFEKNPTDENLAMRIGTFYHYGLGVERDINRAISWYKTAVQLGNQNAQQKIDEATQQQDISLMGIASVACHIGKILNTETTAAFKQKYSSDTKILRKEKMQKIESGHAVSDKPFDYDY